MPICSNCKTSEAIQQGLYKDVPFAKTPCSRCQLYEDSRSVLTYIEACTTNSSCDANPDDEEWDREEADRQSPQPYAVLDGQEEDPLVPLSKLVEAFEIWLRLDLPSRKTFQMRAAGLPFSEIGKRLGFSRQRAERLLSRAIAADGRLHNLLPAKKTPLSATRKSPVMAVPDRIYGTDIGKDKKTLKNEP
jgi:hypothetical protein